MKCSVPEISWHNRDPVLSLDVQFNQKSGFYRLATGGADTHVVIWHVNTLENGNLTIDCVADLTRHTHAVNVVRFSPSGDFLASGDDEAIIWIWHCVGDKSAPDIFETKENENKENWTVLRALRGHLNDVCDLSWAPDGLQLLSGSVDNTAILWDTQKGRSIKILSDHKGFVQGVCWDPTGNLFATLSSDRSCLVYNANTLKVSHRIQKTYSSEGTTQRPLKLFHDDTFKSFCRRLSFSPDGQLLIAPAGITEGNDGKKVNVVHVFSRHSLTKPALHFPMKDKYAVAVKCCPVLYELREPCPRIFNNCYRVIVAVATQDTILFYDSQQLKPIALVTNIHYARLTDLTWSQDGKMVAASSTDGYCSFLSFADGELGTPYKAPVVNVPLVEEIPRSVEHPKGSSPQVRKSAVRTPTSSKRKSLDKNAESNKRRVSLVTLFSRSAKKIVPEVAEAKSPKDPTPNVITLDDTTDVEDLPIQELVQEPGSEDLTLVLELTQQVPETSKPVTEPTTDKDPRKGIQEDKSGSPNVKKPRRVPFTTLSTPPGKKDPKL